MKMNREYREILRVLIDLSKQWDEKYANGEAPRILYLDELGLILVPVLEEDFERVLEVPLSELQEAVQSYSL